MSTHERSQATLSVDSSDSKIRVGFHFDPENNLCASVQFHEQGAPCICELTPAEVTAALSATERTELLALLRKVWFAGLTSKGYAPVR